MQLAQGLFNPALIISILALLFTVLSFWWMNWRKGKLHVGAPRSYAAFGSMEGKMVLEFPFVFFNDGPIPIVVQNLRILILDEKSPRSLTFVATVKQMGKHDENRSLATQFPVRGREAVMLICEFQRFPGGLLFEERTYTLELQGKIDKNKKWRRLCVFDFNVSKQSVSSINNQFITHDNISES